MDLCTIELPSSCLVAYAQEQVVPWLEDVRRGFEAYDGQAFVKETDANLSHIKRYFTALCGRGGTDDKRFRLGTYGTVATKGAENALANLNRACHQINQELQAAREPSVKSE